MKREVMIEGVDNSRLFGPETRKNTMVKWQVVLFCYKHPKMRFTAECIHLDNKEEKMTLKKELQDLVTQEIISQQISDAGVVFYYLKRTQQKLGPLTQDFASVQQQPEKS